MDKEKNFVVINGKNVEYYVIKKKIKNMNMRLSDSGEIIITIPKYLSLQKAKDFLVSKYSWIEKQQKKYLQYSQYKESEMFIDNEFLYFRGNKYTLRINSSNENSVRINGEYLELRIKEKYVQNSDYIKRFYENWLKDYCFEICSKYVEKYKALMSNYNVPNTIKIEIKKYKAKWGACMPTKKHISFNMNLIKTPDECLEYVVVHELSHFKYFNHNKNFYTLVEKFIPNWKERKKLLNDIYGRVLI